MPRDSQGRYGKPVGTAAEPGTTITSSQFNSTVDDLVADANLPRPVSAGGTGATTAAAARTNLAVAEKVENTSDFTADRGLIVGSGGLLGNAITAPSTNLNDIVTGGRWVGLSTYANMPIAATGVLEVIRRANNRYIQIFTAEITGRQYIRTFNGTTWTAWALSSAATAGSNDNGSWRLYSDGRLVCTRSISSIDLTQESPLEYPYPAPFASRPIAWFSINRNTTITSSVHIAVFRDTFVQATGTGWALHFPSNPAYGTSVDLRLIAEGTAG